MPPMSGISDYMPDAEPSKWLMMLSDIFIYLCIIISILLAVALVIQGLYRIYHRYYQAKMPIGREEKIEIIPPFEKIRLSIFGAGVDKRRSFTGIFIKSNNDRIRRSYKKAIEKNVVQKSTMKKDGISKIAIRRNIVQKSVAQNNLPQENAQPENGLSFKTPSELSEYAIGDGGIINEKNLQKETITELYEKARYSGKECTKEEVQKVKRLLGR